MVITTQILQQCARCVMDTSDPTITFNTEGVCHHCQRYDVQHRYWQQEAIRLPDLITTIKRQGHGKPYDCIVGLSGGVDSSFLLYSTVFTFQLRPYVFHIDTGWNTDVAMMNMRVLCEALDVELHEYPIDAELVYDLQRAFLRSGVPDVDIASDHMIRAMYWDLARDLDIQHVLYGGNYRTETHGVEAWSQGHGDWTYIRGIHHRFGTRPTAIPHYSAWRLLWHRVTKRPKLIPLLNYLVYQPERARVILKDLCGYQSYGGKHGENIFTRWFQGYYLPTRFGYDKRKCHLSNLVCAGDLTRHDALHQLAVSPYGPDVMAEDTVRVCACLGITPTEWRAIMEQPIKSYDDYPHSQLLTTLIALKRKLR